MKSSGWADKLYWRKAIPDNPLAQWHCFKKAAPREWVPLCGVGFILIKTGGQGIQRPCAELRCAACDIAEMRRRGWEWGGRESKPPGSR